MSMKSVASFGLLLAISLGNLSGSAMAAFRQASEDVPSTSFEGDVLPILEAYCVRCHGGEATRADFDLRNLPALLSGGESGEPGIVPGDSASSLLIDVMDSGLMPPEPHDPPSAEEIGTIRAWIDSGADAELQGRAGAIDDQQGEAKALQIFDLLDFKCIDCHGRNGVEAGLDLRTAASAITGGKSGPAVVPEDPESSLLIHRLVADEMPPREGRFDLSIKPVTEADLNLLREWIADGAREFPVRESLDDDGTTYSESDQSWWSFQAPQVSELPEVQGRDLVRNPIDAFLLKRLESAGLSFSAEADRVVLMRRVSFDLTGMPPSPEEVEAFLNDDRPDAYERLVEHLLASPRYGERWAQPWLDAAGFVESEGGDGNDPVRQEYHRYRDYVVRSINEDTPFDQFLTEQLAGDELANWLDAPSLSPEGADAIVATGFLRTVVDPTDRPVHNFPPDRQQVLADTVSVVGSSLMGLTIGCARCHSHKYDPISQADYSRLSAVFAGAYTPQDWLKPRERLVPLASLAERQAAEEQNAAIEARLEPLRSQLKSQFEDFKGRLLDRRLKDVPEVIRADVRTALLLEVADRDEVQTYLAEKFAEEGKVAEDDLDETFPEYKEKSARLQTEIDAIEAEKIVLPTARALVDDGPQAPPFYLQIRGDAYRRGGEAPPDVPSVLKPAVGGMDVAPPWPGATSTGRRLAFARWLTRPEHPLTSRVFVNRTWQQIFGRGIVATVDNFGRTGSLPTHPELLDWLALDFVQNGWSLKHLHRRLVTSQAYRQSSELRAEGRQADPENVLLWRMPLRRLQAEWVRDATLAAAGTLNPEMYGPSDPVVADKDGLVHSSPEDARSRRSVYMLHRRSQPLTILELFDAPQMNPNCLERRTSIVAPQALLLLNGEWIREQAKALARVVRDEAGADPDQQIERAYLRVLSRPPSSAETDRALAFLADQAMAYQEAPPCSEDDEPDSGDVEVDPARLAFIDLCHVLLNAPDFHYLD